MEGTAAEVAATLAPGTPPVLFAGDVPAFGEPLDGPALDLNVMTRRGRFDSALTRHTLTHTLEVEPAHGTLLVLALSDLILGGAGSDARLARLDAACLEGACGIIRIPAPAACYLIRITACA
jgi:uncharacterized protein